MTRFSRAYAALLSDQQDARQRAKIDAESRPPESVRRKAAAVTSLTGEAPGDRPYRRVILEREPPIIPRAKTPPKGEPIFRRLCIAAGYPRPETEYQFHPTRKWRFDYAWPDIKLALEVEGGIFVQGRHTRGAGMLEDMAKYSAAALLGWRIVYYTPDNLALAIIDLRGIFRG